MFVAPLQQIDNVPTLYGLIGGVQSQVVLDNINSKWGGTASVAFGQISNPMNEHYRNFMGLIQGQIARTDNLIREVTQSVLYPEHWRVIDSEEALAAAPACMQPALLMTPGVFELFKEGKLSAWNWDPATFPDEDVYGKQLENGRITIHPDDADNLPEAIVSTYDTAEIDFQMTEEQMDILEQSRKFLMEELARELGENGQRRDITDLSNTISV